MKSLFLILTMSLSTTQAFGFAGTFFAPSLVPDEIVDVKYDVYNYAQTRTADQPECGSSECYRMDVYLNDIHVATFVTSPGKPASDGGIYTPIYNGTPVHTMTHAEYYGYTTGYYMPYAMFFESLSNPGKISNIAIHSGWKADGERRSHGCLRTLLPDARNMFKWNLEAKRNGGNGYLWTRHTRDLY